MFFKKKKPRVFKAFTNGQIVPLDKVPDPVFSAGLVGPGIAILSKDGKYFSPVDGQITMVFPTGHALGMRTEKGEELLLHIGLDTVNLKGEGFKVYVKDGQKVACGDLLVEADLSFIKEQGYATEAVLCLTEPKEIDLTFTNQKEVVLGDVLVQINH